MAQLVEEREATIFITGQCNANCIMCPCSDYERKNKTGISDEEMNRYIDGLPKDTEYIVITGGEPTLKTEQFFSVMERLAEQFPSVEMLLLTNGRSFAAKSMVSRLLVHCPPFLTIAIPLHGPNSFLHDAITRTKESFRQSMAGIKNLLAYHVAVEIRVVVSKLNYFAVNELADLIIREIPTVLVVNFVGLEVMGNCALNFEKVYIDYETSFQCCKSAAKKLISAGIDVGFYNYPLCAVEKGFWPLCKKSITPYKVKFSPECDQCEAKSFCGGFFSSTYAVAKPIVKPFRSETTGGRIE